MAGASRLVYTGHCHGLLPRACAACFRQLFAAQLLPVVPQLAGVAFAIVDVTTNTAQQIGRCLWRALRCTSVSVC